MGKRTGVYKYIHALPRDAYGNRYRIGGKVLSQKFGLGTVIGVARGGDGRICVVCNFRAPTARRASLPLNGARGSCPQRRASPSR